jgi:hypothetical protein
MRQQKIGTKKMTTTKLREYLKRFSPNGVPNDLMVAYCQVREMLDLRHGKISAEQAKALSNVSSVIAVTFTSITGRTIGKALGWDKLTP